MLEVLATKYYYEDELSEELLAQIEKCNQRARRVLPKTINEFIRQNHSLHDWHVSGLALYCKDNQQVCKITFTKNQIEYHMNFFDVRAFSIYGEIISSDAQYPSSHCDSSFAQVLAIWIDYHRSFEFCILLDNERFIVLVANDVSLCE